MITIQKIIAVQRTVLRQRRDTHVVSYSQLPVVLKATLSKDIVSHVLTLALTGQQKVDCAAFWYNQLLIPLIYPRGN